VRLFLRITSLPNVIICCLCVSVCVCVCVCERESNMLCVCVCVRLGSAILARCLIEVERRLLLLAHFLYLSV